MRRASSFVLFLTLSLNLLAQSIQSPREFLGYELGERFTSYHRVVEYFKYVSTKSPKVKLQEYGQTYEGRTLVIAFIGSEKNTGNIEGIRSNNLRLSRIEKGNGSLDQPAIVWLSYNVHGNEAVSTEASMQTLFDLVDPRSSKAAQWLDNTLVVIDPCVNPDGRERYVNFYNSVRNIVPDPLPFSREHMEPWPGGRPNHYYFDLNRDWAWQTQKETQQRMQLYNKWLPQIHVDFHEQSLNSPYFFAPAAEPFHRDITPWQREFQTIIGKNNARYFDEKGWLYFTKERFDLLYPSYGDTYPTYNGAVGMTYEQGGSGRAGLAVINREGDTLTLRDRIIHHHTSGLATIETVSANAGRVLSEYERFFKNSVDKPVGDYKAYVIKGENQEKVKALALLLKRNGIQFGFGSSRGGRGFNYQTGKTESFKVAANDMVISAFQPKSVLLKVLFEPNTFVSDSVTYDITAWALPYAYGLPAYASKDALKPVAESLGAAAPPLPLNSRAFAYAANWNSLADVKLLAELLKRNVKVRYSEVPFETGGVSFNSGSLVITRTGNEALGEKFDEVVRATAEKTGVSIQALSTGFVDKGPDLGSEKFRHIKKPRIAVIGGEETSYLGLGEVWHFFEQQLGYPVSMIRANDFNQADLSKFNVIILPDGNYQGLVNEKLSGWITDGGKLIAMQNAISSLIGKRGFSISVKEDPKAKESSKDLDLPEELRPYANRERELVKSNIPGAIFKVDLDNTHPLAFGFPDYYYTLKLDDKIYSFLNDGWNVGVLRKNNYVTGFAGAQTKKRLVNGLLFGVQESGNGSVVYMVEDPLFRGFWENGKLLFSNAVFMVGQ